MDRHVNWLTANAHHEGDKHTRKGHSIPPSTPSGPNVCLFGAVLLFALKLSLRVGQLSDQSHSKVNKRMTKSDQLVRPSYLLRVIRVKRLTAEAVTQE